MVLCNEPSQNCFLRNCELCKGGFEGLSSILEQVFQNKNIKSVTYKQWFNNSKPTLEKVTKSVDDFIPYFCEKMLELPPHSFIAYEQSKYSRQLKNDLKEGEFLIIVDFAENYAFLITVIQ